jgi:hypothetical protein
MVLEENNIRLFITSPESRDMLENNNVNASGSGNLLHIFNTLFSLVQIYTANKTSGI